MCVFVCVSQLHQKNQLTQSPLIFEKYFILSKIYHLIIITSEIDCYF